jgi:hypothetical protein
VGLVEEERVFGRGWWRGSQLGVGSLVDVGVVCVVVVLDLVWCAVGVVVGV